MSTAVASCDIELQPVLHNNAVLTGANTLLPGFADRVYNELHRTSNGVF
jgi:actin-related protein